MTKISVEEGLEEYKRFIFFKAYTLAQRNWHDAEDLAQEAICLALRHKDTWSKFNMSFQTWMKYHLLTARRTYYVGRRTIQDCMLYERIEIDEGKTIDETCDDVELIDMITKMPFPNIAMYAYAGYKQTDIRDILGISVETVKRRSKKNNQFYKEATA